MIFQNVLLTAIVICNSVFSPHPETKNYGELFCSAPSDMKFKDIPTSDVLTGKQISKLFLIDTANPFPGLVVFYCTYKHHDFIVTVYRCSANREKISISIMNYGPVA